MKLSVNLTLRMEPKPIGPKSEVWLDSRLNVKCAGRAGTLELFTSPHQKVVASKSTSDLFRT